MPTPSTTPCPDLVVTARPLVGLDLCEDASDDRKQSARPSTAPPRPALDHSDLKAAMRLVAENPDMLRVKFRPKPSN